MVRFGPPLLNWSTQLDSCKPQLSCPPSRPSGRIHVHTDGGRGILPAGKIASHEEREDSLPLLCPSQALLQTSFQLHFSPAPLQFPHPLPPPSRFSTSLQPRSQPPGLPHLCPWLPVMQSFPKAAPQPDSWHGRGCVPIPSKLRSQPRCIDSSPNPWDDQPCQPNRRSSGPPSSGSKRAAST